MMKGRVGVLIRLDHQPALRLSTGEGFYALGFLIALIFFICAAIYPFSSLAEDGHTSNSKSEQGHREKPKRPGEYGKFRREVADFCQALKLDNRADIFGVKIEQLAERDSECLDCRPLIKLLVANCKSQVKRDLKKKKPTKDGDEQDLKVEEDPESGADSEVNVDAEGAAEVSEAPPAEPVELSARISTPFVPGIRQVDAASLLGRALSSRDDISETRKVFSRIEKQIEIDPSFARGERLYGAAILSFLLAPIDDRLSRIRPESVVGQVEEEDDRAKEELFPKFR